MTNRIKELEKELKAIQVRGQTEQKVKQLKKQIKYEEFRQTRGGKVFHGIADIGQKILTPKKQVQGKPKKKVRSVKELMADIDRAVKQVPM